MTITSGAVGLMPKILAKGLTVLREMAIMPRLVNTDYSSDAKQKGDTIQVPVSAAGSVYNVTPSNVSPAPGNVTPTTIPISLSNWKGSSFYLTSKNLAEIDMNQAFLPMQMEEAIRALANQLNSDVFSMHTSVYGFSGTPGTTPFVATTDATTVRKGLNIQLCPPDDRRFVIDPNAEANALNLVPFQAAYAAGDAEVIKNGQIGHRLGFDFASTTTVPTHVSGTQTGTVTVNAAAVGVSTVTIATAASSSFNYNLGDIITFAGDTQTYAVTAATGAVGASSSLAVSISPALVVAQAGGGAVALKASHVCNLAFHRNAFALAMRPLANEVKALGLDGWSGETMVMQDKVSGIPLRLDVYQQYQQVVWEFSILYGFACVRPQLAWRLAG